MAKINNYKNKGVYTMSKLLVFLYESLKEGIFILSGCFIIILLGLAVIAPMFGIAYLMDLGLNVVVGTLLYIFYMGIVSKLLDM